MIDGDMVRLSKPIPEPCASTRTMLHQDLSHIPRIRAAIDWIPAFAGMTILVMRRSRKALL